MTITARIDATTRIPETHRAGIIPAPHSVKIELTGVCDFKCFFCATGQNIRPKGHMPWELFKTLAKEIRAAGVDEIGLFYLGESMLSPILPDAIRYAKTDCRFPYVFLTTNGYRATADKLRACFEAGLDSLKFSFNAADAEQAKTITRVDCFDAQVQHIRDAHKVREEVVAKTGRRCGLYASSIQYDGEQQDCMKKAVTAIRPYLDEHYWLPLYSQHTLATGEIEKRGFKATAGNMGRIGGLRDPLPCWAVFTEGHITWDGKLSACCFSHTDEFTMADLTKTNFAEAWNSVEFQALRGAHLAKDVEGTCCERCVAYV